MDNIFEINTTGDKAFIGLNFTYNSKYGKGLAKGTIRETIGNTKTGDFYIKSNNGITYHFTEIIIQP